MTAAAYARAIERNWSDLSGRAGVLSSRDWARICAWYARNIPLELVREVLTSSFEKGRGRRPPRSLAALAPAIEEAWAVVLQGRLAPGSPASAAPVPLPDPLLAWRLALEAQDPHSPLRRLLEDVVARIDAGEPPESVELELEQRIAAAAPPDVVARLLRSIDRDLAPFKSRMAPGQHEATRHRALIERLRREIGAPRLPGGALRRPQPREHPR